MNALYRATDTCVALAKIALLSHRTPRFPKATGERIIILGNGPSLNKTIAEHRAALDSAPLLAVNFAASAPIFAELKPEYYVLADPLFFIDDAPDNLLALRSALTSTSWPLTLFVPFEHLKAANKYYAGTNINITPFNAVGIDGAEALTHKAFAYRRALPRPRNVLIPAIMIAIWLGYKEIFITGADHSWMTTISVTDDNEVVSVQPHFYADSDAEHARVRHEYRGYRLHQIVESFAVAFRSYHHIAAFARRRGINIYNATPGSFIDAFERKSL